MILRPYQEKAVSAAAAALREHGNTLVVAPTGAGKTILLSALAGAMQPRRALILQHRDELVAQNMTKYRMINPTATVSQYTAARKSWDGSAVFGMVQTLARPRNLDTIPGLDLVIVDECHHVAAHSYRQIIDRAKEQNPKVRIAGFTATPMRADGKGLRAVFTNCSSQISIRHLIELGFLVPPRAYIVDVGAQEELFQVRKLASDYDMAEVSQIMNKTVINNEVVRHWKEKAGDRKTIAFCSTIEHAQEIVKAFRDAGMTADLVTGDMKRQRRKLLLHWFQTGTIQVLVNVGVLVEGFDEPTVSCVVLLRPCSFKSTMIQMIGRGLRPVNCKDHPGVIKRDCIVLDFGTSILQHGDLYADVDLTAGSDSYRESTPGEAPTKVCPVDADTAYIFPDCNEREGCGASVPAGCGVCPFCGFIFQRDNGESELKRIALQEVDLINSSPFRWVDLYGNGKVLIASGFGTFAAVASPDGETWYALGKQRESRGMERLVASGKIQALAQADDYMRQHETSTTAMKSARWMKEPASQRQLELLAQRHYPVDQISFTKLTATAFLNFSWNQKQIERLIGVAA